MSFRVALSGLNAASADLSTTANNIANANTTGFKASRAQFGDMFASSQGLATTDIGSGVRLNQVQQQFSQGTINFTSNALDMAIGGDGFFTMSENGALSYTRDGAFQVDREGFIVNGSGQRLQGYDPIAGGGFNRGGLGDIRLDAAESQPQATTDIDTSLNLPANAQVPATTPFDATDPTSFNHSTALTVFDSLGASHTMNLFYVKTATANTWEVNVQLDGADVGTATPIEFDANGALTTPASGELTLPAVTLTNGAADLNMTVDVGSTTQFGDRFSVSSLSQDGFSSGRLVGIDIGDTGVVSARFTNGQNQDLAQVAVTKFTNPQGLQAIGDTSWGETFDSGSAQLGAAGDSGFGSIQSNALEASNVDLTEQLVNMITAQRNFQANAQMITTADQVTQAALNIR